MLCSPGVITARKAQQKEVNADEAPSICGQKKGINNTSCFCDSKMDSRTFCTNCLQCLPMEFCLLEGFFFQWMELSLSGLEKEHTSPELGKGNVIPLMHTMLTAQQWLGSIRLWQGCWVPAFMCFLFHVHHPGLRAGWYISVQQGQRVRGWVITEGEVHKLAKQISSSLVFSSDLHQTQLDSRQITAAQGKVIALRLQCPGQQCQVLMVLQRDRFWRCSADLHPLSFLKAAVKATLPCGRAMMDRKPVGGVQQRNRIIYKNSFTQVVAVTICSGQELYFLWVLSFCHSVFQINFDTTSVTTALKSELNVLWRSLFITTQMEREYFPFERSCQTCPVLCLLSEALWSFLRRKGDEGKKGQRPAFQNHRSETQ